MSVLKVVATLNRKSQIPADACQNSYVFVTPSTPPSTVELDAIETRLTGFYNNIAAGQGVSIASRLGDVFAVGASDNFFEFFDITGKLNGLVPAGPPIRLDTWGLSAIGTTSLPAETAVAISYSANLAGISEFGPGTRPRARRRGRVFIGPLAQVNVAQDATTRETSPAATLVTALTVAAKKLVDDNLIVGASEWKIWSRADATTYPIVRVCVDNAFDSQRRRGNEPTVKTCLGAPPL